MSPSSKSDRVLAQAIAAHRAGDFKVAEKGYRAVLKKKLSHPTALHMLGVVQLKTDRPNDARKTLARASKADPASAEVFYDLGMADKALNMPHDALGNLEKALLLNPNLQAAEYQIGILHREARSFEKAESSFRTFIGQLPREPHGYLELGNVFRDTGNLHAALAQYEKAAAVAPKASVPHQNRGVTLADLGDFDGGIAALEQAIELQPDNMQAWHTRALAIRDRDGLEAGLEAVDQAIRQKDDEVWSHVTKAELLFEAGRLNEAWQEYMWRRAATGMKALRQTRFGATAWTGEPFAGRHVLLRGEQGLGEQILFSSLIPDLLAEATSVVIECEDRLVPLLDRSFPAATVIEKALHSTWTHAAPRPDVELAIGDLGGPYRDHVDAFPRHSGYLKVDDARVASLRAHYQDLAGGRPVVGVSWRSFNLLSAWRKSVPLALWYEILRRDDLFFVDVQYGDVDQERVELAERGHTLYRDANINPVEDVDGAAAQLAALDILLSTSNSCVHVAGGLGLPAVLMLPARIERHWYWFPGLDPNPWYPSVTVVQQKQPTVWPECLSRAQKVLDEKLSAMR